MGSFSFFGKPAASMQPSYIYRHTVEENGRADWWVWIHVAVPNESILISNHEIIEGVFYEKNAMDLRKDLYKAMKPYHTGINYSYPNEINDFVQPDTKYEEYACCKRTKYSI